MGYRSDVAIKCQQNAFLKFKSIYEKYDFTPDRIYINDDQDQFVMYWEWTKWYDDYDEVNAINNLMGELDSVSEEEAINNGLAYRMARIGEDMSDTEERGNNWFFDLYIQRKIDFGKMNIISSTIKWGSKNKNDVD